MAGDGKRVIQGGSLGSGMGADCKASSCQGYVAVDSFDLVVVKAVCRGGKDARYLVPLLQRVFGGGKQWIIGRYAGAVLDGNQSYVYFFKHYI